LRIRLPRTINNPATPTKSNRRWNWLEFGAAYGTIERMVIPQFSLRWILAVTAVCAVFSLILAAAVRGSPWAIALSIAVASLAITLAFHGAVFFGVWLFSLIVPDRRRTTGGPADSPFAGGTWPQATSPFVAAPRFSTGPHLAIGQAHPTQDGKPHA
jgi:hypothetical protein